MKSKEAAQVFKKPKVGSLVLQGLNLVCITPFRALAQVFQKYEYNKFSRFQ